MPMKAGPTEFLESNAILAAQENNLADAKQYVQHLTPTEQHRLKDAAYKLIRIIENEQEEAE